VLHRIALAVEGDLHELGVIEDYGMYGGVKVDFRTARVLYVTPNDNGMVVFLKCVQEFRAKPRSPSAPAMLELRLDFIQLDDGTTLGGASVIKLANDECADALLPEAFMVQRATREAWQEYCEARDGFPHGGIDHVLRMLYFSAITATTVGYGDIVPLTNLARALAGTEAIFSVALAGFFVNAATSSRKNRTEWNDPKPFTGVRKEK
jgi:hypothetical protein